MRRKPGTLTHLELELLEAALSLASRGATEFHGFLLAKELKALANAWSRIAYGTLYKTLGRLEGTGLLSSYWEDPAIGEGEGRPRRRIYKLTTVGEQAVRQASRSPSVVRLVESADSL